MKQYFPDILICFPTFSLDSQQKFVEKGFSLIEVMAAMVIMLIALLGVFTVFTYSINYNSGNNSRSQALMVLRQETELLQSAGFTPSSVDPVVSGGIKAPKIVASADGSNFSVQTTVDDDPFVGGVQTDNFATLKEITVTVTLESPSPGWQTAMPATTILRKVRSH